MGYQEIIDGLHVDKNQARFTGTFDLDERDLEALAMDRVAFLVVAVRIEEMKAKVTPDADVKRVNVLRVQDARVARGDLREDAVEWLAGKNGQMTMDFREKLGLAPPDGPEFDRPDHVDENGEILSEVEVVAEPRETTERVPTTPLSGQPGVAKFDPDSFEGIPDSDAPVPSEGWSANVYSRERKDDRLRQFMETGK